MSRYLAYILSAITLALGSGMAHAEDPATSPFAADRYDYSVLSLAKEPAAHGQPQATPSNQTPPACQLYH